VTGDERRFYFHVRNTIYMLRGTTWERSEKLSLMWFLFSTTQAFLRYHRFRRRSVAVVARGLRDGLRRVRS